MKRIMALMMLLPLFGCQPDQQLSTEGAKTILFDTAHGETAGESDWVVDGAFSTFGDALKKKGFRVESTQPTAVITDDLLKNKDLFVLSEPNIPLKNHEQQALKRYVENGGSILFISDHYNADRNLNRFDASEVLNGYRRGAFQDPTKGMSHDEKNSEMMKDVTGSDFLSNTFGVRFRYNALDDIIMTDMDNAFGILDNVKKVQMHAGSTLAITDPKKAKGLIFLPKLTAKDRWEHAVDQGVYNGGGRNEGPFIAISKPSAGKAAFIGDSSIVEDATPKYKREDNGRNKDTYDGYDELDHDVLLMNLVEWLVHKEQYTSFEGQLTLDEKTPLLDMENPSTSTEQSDEPWAKPIQGYLWYDRSTYAPGSFGTIQPPISNKKVNGKTDKDLQIENKAIIVSPARVKPSEYVQIRVQTTTPEPVAIEITVDGKQMGLFSGRPPGRSDTYTGKRKNNYYESYYNGKIARESYGTLTISAYNGQTIIGQKEMIVE